MLKVILLLDCNECGLAMESALVSSLSDARDWQSAGYSLMDQLNRLAADERWDFNKSRMVCGVCRPDQPDDEED
jgi:hypothetical protein